MVQKKRITIYEEYCIGCRLCEINCLVAHSKSKHILKAFKEEFNNQEREPHIIVEACGYLSFGLPCRHCEDAPCLESCMTGALYRDERTGAVLLNKEKCVGCFMCIMNCPYGVIKRGKGKDNKKIASKCDLCVDTPDQIPACVKNCPNEALVFECIDEEAEEGEE